MSKLAFRVFVSLLICLVVVVGIYTSVQGASLDAKANLLSASVKSHASVGRHAGVAAPAATYYQYQSDGHHGCDSESYYNPADD